MSLQICRRRLVAKVNQVERQRPASQASVRLLRDARQNVGNNPGTSSLANFIVLSGLRSHPAGALWLDWL
jgi:hypothetical protein